MAIVTREHFTAVGTQLGTAAAALVSAATGEVVAIDKVLVFNTGGTTENLDFYLEATGGTPGANDKVAEFAVGAGAHSDLTALANLTLDAGESLFANTDTATTVNITVSGRRIVG